jgi:hypothetical protein
VKFRAILKKIRISDTQIAQLVECITCIAACTKIGKNKFGQSDQTQAISPDSTNNYQTEVNAIS